MDMKNLLLGSAAFAALFMAVPAVAADMKSAPVYTKAPMTAPLYDWTGLYIGGHATYSWANSNSSTINTATGALDASGSGSTSNFHGGGQIGFDYMMPSRVVIGVLADVSTGDDSTNTFSNAAGTNVHTEEGKTDVGGTVRGRLGYALDTVLLYGTGGWAYNTGSATRTQILGTVGTATPGIVETTSTSHNGWTVGGGLAYAFWRNWNLFGEYRYSSFQSNTVTFPLAQRSTTSTTTANAITAGVNLKFGGM
jgi:opacity protein-like surface antigen